MAKILKAKRNFNFYIEDFMEYCKLKGLSRKTMKSYESSLLLFSKYIEEEYQLSKVEEIKLTHAKEYVKFTKERGKYSFIKKKGIYNKSFLCSLDMLLVDSFMLNRREITEDYIIAFEKVEEIKRQSV